MPRIPGTRIFSYDNRNSAFHSTKSFSNCQLGKGRVRLHTFQRLYDRPESGTVYNSSTAVYDTLVSGAAEVARMNVNRSGRAVSLIILQVR